MQPQRQQMQDMGMGMQQGQQMQSNLEMAPQIPSPETQLNMNTAPTGSQEIVQQPDVMQAPAMMKNGDMNMAQSQIYEKPADLDKESLNQAAAAPPPTPPPNFPPINTQPSANSDLNQNIANYDSNNNIDPNTKELVGDADKAKEKLRQDIENFKNDLTPEELKIYQEAFRS